MKVLILLHGRAYQKTKGLLPYLESAFDCRTILIGAEATGMEHTASSAKASLPQRVVRFGLQSARQYLKQHLAREIRHWKPDVIYTNPAIVSRFDIAPIWGDASSVIVRLGGHLYQERWDGLQHRRPGLPYLALLKIAWHRIDRLLQHARGITVVTQDMARQLSIDGHLPLGKMAVVPVPCNMGRFQLPKARGHSRVLAINHLEWTPQLNALLDFLPALNAHNDVRIIAPGFYRGKVAQKSSHPVWGYTEHIERQYQSAGVFCHFSYLDGCPNVVLEAWASHTPVIANRCAWSEELIRHGETGILVNTPQEARDGIALLQSDTALHDRLTANAYSYLCDHHTTAIAGRRLVEVFREIHE